MATLTASDYANIQAMLDATIDKLREELEVRFNAVLSDLERDLRQEWTSDIEDKANDLHSDIKHLERDLEFLQDGDR